MRLFRRRQVRPPYSPYHSWHEYDLHTARPSLVLHPDSYRALMWFLFKEDVEASLHGKPPLCMEAHPWHI